MKIKVLAIATLILCVTSCKTVEPYLPVEELEAMSGQIDIGNYELRIVPDDMISITVSSSVPDAASPYNLPAVSYSTPGSRELTVVPNLQVYTVNRDGNINFPVLGEIHVAGMTRTELCKYIEDKIRPEVVDPFVLVQFMNFKVVVLGEVKQPGQVSFQTDRVSIFDALGAVGDITNYGERSNVLLIREQDGKRIYHTFDLTDKVVFESPYYYLQQNDVIYVSPNKAQRGNSKYNQQSQYRVSVTSSIISAVSVIASLCIALFIK